MKNATKSKKVHEICVPVNLLAIFQNRYCKLSQGPFSVLGTYPQLKVL